jgi:2,4-dienoyl-CoA reductase-like NADH-dependent reductase (Old Yellow Enzyme family)
LEAWPVADTPFPHLFSPLALRHKTLKHRLNLGAHTANMAEGGLPGARHLGYYAERARGGAAMIVVEPVPVHRTAVLTRGNFRHNDDAVVPAFRRLTDACHEFGTVMIQQLYHVGAHGDPDNSFAPNWSPSGRPSYHDSDGSHAMSEAEIEETIESFVQAARRAREAGFDGVELHYAHAYTMASFLSRTNHRSDGYGGDEAGRLRLPLEVFEAVRARVGDDYVVGCRFLGDEVIEGGSDLDDAARHGVAFARAGMDFLSVSKGGKFDDAKQPKVGDAVYPYTGRSGYECMPTVISDERGPFGRNVPLAARIRADVRDAGFETPVVAAGGINSFELAEGILTRGEADIIGAARQSLADPDWFLKMRLGRGEEIRRCKFTNYCEALDTKHKQVTCQLWDRTELDEPDVPLSHDGRRRLVAPTWRR